MTKNEYLEIKDRWRYLETLCGYPVYMRLNGDIGFSVGNDERLRAYYEMLRHIGDMHELLGELSERFS